MSERDEYLDARDVDRVRGALRSAPEPRADDAFRARLKEAFTSGAIEQDIEPRVVRLPRPWLVRPALVATLAAAAGLIVVLGFLNLGPAWSIEKADDGTTALHLPGRIAMEASAETEMDVPRRPGRWLGRGIELNARGGVVRITTGPGFKGTTLRVRTPEAEVVVRGTTLAVIMEEEGTCVCVYDGEVLMGAHGGKEMIAIPGGGRCFMFKDGRPPDRGDIRKAEEKKLAAFRGTKEQVLEAN